MMRKSIYAAICLLLALGGIVLLTVLTGSPWMLAAGCFPVLLPITAFFWNGSAASGLEARLKAEAGKTITGTVTVKARKLPPLGRLSAQVVTENDLTGESASLLIPLTSAPDGWSGQFSLSSRYCGRIRLSVNRVFVTDPLGLLTRKAGASAQARTAVLPETFPVELDIPSLTAAGDEGTGGNRKGPDPTELLWLREYRPGDSLKAIHWKLSSKLDTLLFKESGRPEDRSLLVWWDPCGDVPEVMDALANGFFSVILALSEAGCPFTVGWMRNQEPHFETPVGETELIRLLPTLLQRCDSSSPPELTGHYGCVLHFTAAPPRLPGASNVQVLCCLKDPEPLDTALVFTPENCRQQLQRLEVSNEA